MVFIVVIILMGTYSTIPHIHYNNNIGELQHENSEKLVPVSGMGTSITDKYQKII